MATAVVEERQLLKTLRWYDGFAIALCNPGFLLGSLGFTLGSSAPGALILWGISAFIGVLRRSSTRSRDDVPGPAGRHLPLRPRGLAQVHDLVGPVATFGYWIGWSVVLSIFGKIIGDLIQAAVVPRRHLDRDDGSVHLGLPHFIAIGVIITVWAVQRLRHPPVRVAHLPSRGVLMVPAVRLHRPAVPHRRLARLEPPQLVPRSVGRRQGRAGVPVHPRLVGVRDRDLCHLRARVLRHQARHCVGAEERLDLRAARLHAAAAGPWRRDRRPLGRHC